MSKKTAPSKEMPFLDHLEELRWRLLWSIGALVVGTIVGLLIVDRFDLLIVLVEPFCKARTPCVLAYLHPADPFLIYLKLSISAGIVLASPVVLYQLWAFVSPALYQHERRVGMYVLAGGLVLFSLGVALAYFFVLPATLRFFDLFSSEALQAVITAPAYFGMVISLSLTFGAAFELPILIVALTALGLVTPAFLRRYRRHAFVLCAVGSALITPGDIIVATVALMFPLYALYELGIVLSRSVHKWRVAREEHIDGDSDDAPASA